MKMIERICLCCAQVLAMAAQAEDGRSVQDVATTDPGTTDDAAATGSETLGPNEILSKLHQENLNEIQEGELAQSNAKSSQVKKFGKRVVHDHQQADKLVMAQAKKLGIDLSTTAAAGQGEGQQEVSQLRALQGVDFDRQFLQHEVQGHEKTIGMVKSAEASSQDKGVKKTLAKILPKLQDHLKAAQALERKAGAPATGQR